MDIKTAYGVYNALMKMQKFYAKNIGNPACLPALEGDIKRMEERCGCREFAHVMCGILKRWFEGRIAGPPDGQIVEFYRDLWVNFHRKYLEMENDGQVFWERMYKSSEELNRKYNGCRQLQEYLLAITAELEGEK